MVFEELFLGFRLEGFGWRVVFCCFMYLGVMERKWKIKDTLRWSMIG